ncbi:serine/threonine-protein kinase [Streptomyces sp. enrichment culture]|uniref:serine/threonine-protein kinase n=1 Tax=Streptomyces sp. enrichment culture TaxID=1795815 RepID=UPI003F576062
MWQGDLIAGRYELREQLGRGGMGEAWAARDKSLHRDVVIKLILPHRAGDEPALRRFEREAVAVAQISHPHVVVLYDRGMHTGMPFLVMERIHGRSLKDLLHDEGPLPLPRALRIAEKICLGLAAAHAAQVVHYDIKPGNVMVTETGGVKVLDFGVAGFLRTQTSFDLASSTELGPAGTLAYGAPEQFDGKGDHRSDLYALGGVLFVLLTGRMPFESMDHRIIALRKTLEDAPPLTDFLPDAPPALTALVADLLARDPADRPQSARETVERLRAVRDGASAGAPSGGPPRTQHRSSRPAAAPRTVKAAAPRSAGPAAPPARPPAPAPAPAGTGSSTSPSPSGGGKGGCGLLILVLLVLGYIVSTPDKPLAYRSGTKPECLATGAKAASCTPNTWTWDVAAGKTVTTAFTPPSGEEYDTLHGTIRVRAPQGCEAAVRWTLAAAKAPLAEGAHEARDLAAQTLNQAVPGGTREVTLTVRRTDPHACRAEVAWENAYMN